MPTPTRWVRRSTRGDAGNGARMSWRCSVWRQLATTTTLPAARSIRRRFGLFYPSEGNFIGFIGNLVSRDLVRQVVAAFRQNEQFPSEGAALAELIPRIGDSDHASFWHEGIRH